MQRFCQNRRHQCPRRPPFSEPREGALERPRPVLEVPGRAALETADGKIITGCNVENATYGLTICAERVAIFKAISEGHRRFVRVAVVADTEIPTPPCGACRQILWELGGDLEVILGNLVAETGCHWLRTVAAAVRRPLAAMIHKHVDLGMFFVGKPCKIPQMRRREPSGAVLAQQFPAGGGLDCQLHEREANFLLGHCAVRHPAAMLEPLLLLVEFLKTKIVPQAPKARIAASAKKADRAMSRASSKSRFSSKQRTTSPMISASAGASSAARRR